MKAAKPAPLDPETFARFVLAPDAGAWMKALTDLQGPMRQLLLQHVEAVAAPIPARERLLAGPLLSSTLEGRVVERKARGDWPSAIALAEGISLERVREILADAKNAEREDRRRNEVAVGTVKAGGKLAAADAEAAPAKKPKKKKTVGPGRTWGQVPVEERETLRATALRRYDAGEDVGVIAKDLNLTKQAIYATRYEAKRRAEQGG